MISERTALSRRADSWVDAKAIAAARLPKLLPIAMATFGMSWRQLPTTNFQNPTNQIRDPIGSFRLVLEVGSWRLGVDALGAPDTRSPYSTQRVLSTPSPVPM